VPGGACTAAAWRGVGLQAARPGAGTEAARACSPHARHPVSGPVLHVQGMITAGRLRTQNPRFETCQRECASLAQPHGARRACAAGCRTGGQRETAAQGTLAQKVPQRTCAGGSAVRFLVSVHSGARERLRPSGRNSRRGAPRHAAEHTSQALPRSAHRVSSCCRHPGSVCACRAEQERAPA